VDFFYAVQLQNPANQRSICTQQLGRFDFVKFGFYMAQKFTNRMSNIETEVGNIRRTLMRVVYFLTFIALAPDSFSQLVSDAEPMEPFYGVAVSFWAALSVLAFLGILFPVRMLPLLLLQFAYKLAWVLGVGLPHMGMDEVDVNAEGLMMANGVGVILDFLVIPWIYVFKSYFQKPIFWNRRKD
jgi:hypothetical protein